MKSQLILEETNVHMDHAKIQPSPLIIYLLILISTIYTSLKGGDLPFSKDPIFELMLCCRYF